MSNAIESTVATAETALFAGCSFTVATAIALAEIERLYPIVSDEDADADCEASIPTGISGVTATVRAA